MNIEKIKADLGANFRSGDEGVLEEIINEVYTIASNISNTKASENEALNPYMIKAVKSFYLTRGAEGVKSRNEGSISQSYDDIVNSLRNDIVTNGLRRIY